MEFPSSCRKTFKSHNSLKHSRKISAGAVAQEDDAHDEHQPILLDHNRESSSFSAAPHHHRHHHPMLGPSEVIVKIDGDDETSAAKRNVNRESSLDFWRDDPNRAMQQPGFEFHEDPPLKLIGQFLNKQKASGGGFCLDVDLEMDEFRSDHNNNSSPNFPPLNPNYDDRNQHNQGFPSSKELKVNSNFSTVVDIGPDEQRKSWHNSESSSDEDENQRVFNRRRSVNIGNNTDGRCSGAGNEGQVLRCSSIQRRVSGLGRMKTKSRLIDPPEVLVPDRRSEILKSNRLQSGLLGRASQMLGKQPATEEEEDDPLFGEDLPDDYKKAKFDALTIAQWISLVLIVTALICTLSIYELKKRMLRGLSLWKWEVLVLVLICGRLVSGWGIRIVVFFIERNFFMRKRVLYFVYGVRKAVQNCIWLGLVLIAWHSMFDKEVDGHNRFLWYVNKLMVCMLVGTLLWLVKTLMVKVLASSFHVSTFFDRIQESLFNQYVIETLSGPPLIEIKNHQEEEDRTMAEVWRLQNAGATLPPELRPPTFQPTKSGKVGAGSVGGGLPPRPPTKGVSFRFSGQLTKTEDDQGISIEQLHKLNPKNVSAWNMKRLMKVVKKGVLTTLDERALDSSQEDESATQIRSEQEALCAARKIFRNVAKPRAK